MMFWPWLAFASLSTASQLAFNAGEYSATRTTLVDALSADTDYSHLLKLLQRAKLIPTLNRLNGSTFFAPTNDAFDNTPHLASLLDDNLLVDNMQLALRQLLFYHISNTSVPILSPDDAPLVLETLHYPGEGLQPPTHEPPPSPPWMPIPAGTLGGVPQRLRVSMRTKVSAQDGDNHQLFVGVDAFGNGGVEVVKERVDAGNGILLGIGKVLEPPPTIVTVLTKTPELSYLSDLISQFGPITSFLNDTSALTTFFPVNSAWESLHPLEQLYLHTEFAGNDLRDILSMHIAHNKALAKHEHVVYSEEFDPGLNLTTLSDTELEIVSTPDGVRVDQAALVTPDVYAANGVVHLVSSLLLPAGHSSLRLTPEKFLLALNCTSFVSLLHSVNLTNLIDSSEPDRLMTILAPNDDVLSLFSDSDLPEKGSDELRRMLAYHFLDGIWQPDQVRDGQLVKTLLEEDGLDGGKQVLHVDVSSKTIRFAGASVVGEKVQLNNNTLLYFLSRPINPPAAVLPTLLPHLTFSAFLAAIHSLLHLPEVISNAPLTTILAPRDEAFKRLGGLVSTHLLSPEKSSQSDLERFLKHHVIQGVYYSQALSEGGQRTFPTFEGSDLRLARVENKGSKYANASLELTPSGGWDGLQSEIVLRNLLTKTGVVHEVSDLLLPRSVEIDIEKLVKAAGGTVMLSLIAKAGMGWVLNGTVPPSDEWPLPSFDAFDKKERQRKGDKWYGGWTLLCPTDDAFKGWNLTELERDKDRLKELIGQHIIPTPATFAPSDILPIDAVNSRPLRMDQDASYSTLLSPGSEYGDVVFRATSNPETPGSYIIGIKNARGTAGDDDWARVLSWGRSTASITFSGGNGDNGGKSSRGVGGVIQVSRVLVPYHPSWWIAWGAPTLVGVIGVALICGFFYCVRLVWIRDVQEATYEPVGGFDRSEDVNDIDV